MADLPHISISPPPTAVDLGALSPRLRRLIASQPVHTLGGLITFTAPPPKPVRAVAARDHSSQPYESVRL